MFSARIRTISRKVSNFFYDQHGVVAVEWVALAGAVVIGGVAVAYAVSSRLGTPASSIGTNLSDCETWAAANSTSTSGCN